jgi:hypothetical protein
MIRIEGIPVVAARLAAAQKVRTMKTRKPKVTVKVQPTARPAA